jgi:hypothetical protein
MKKTKYMKKGGAMKKTKYMKKGGAMKKTKYMAKKKRWWYDWYEKN